MRENPYLDRLRAAGAAPEISTMSSARICIPITSAGTLGSRTVAGSRRFRTRNTCSRKPISRRSIRAARHRSRQVRRSHLHGQRAARLRSGPRRLVEGEHMVGDGMTIVPAPGHSPGHCYLRVEDNSDSPSLLATPCITRCRSRRPRSTASPASTPNSRALHAARYSRNAATTIACLSPAISRPPLWARLAQGFRFPLPPWRCGLRR